VLEDHRPGETVVLDVLRTPRPGAGGAGAAPGLVPQKVRVLLGASS
jgi:hypothetical protein